MSDPIQQLLRQASEHHQAGRLSQAEALYRAILQSDPRHAAALHFLGVIEHQRGNHQAACDLIDQAIVLQPDNASFHHNLGHARRAAGDLAAAEAAFTTALRLDPKLAPTHDSLGAVYLAQGKLDHALACFNRALALAPTLAAAHAHVGNVHQRQGRSNEAIAAFSRAFAIRPHADTLINLGSVYLSQRRINEAIDAFQRALAIDPNAADAGSNLLMAMHYLDDIEPQSIFQAHVRWGDRFAAAALNVAPNLASNSSPDRDPNRKLRIAYVSGDLRQHPVGVLMEPILANHDRTRFEVTVYATTTQSDALTEKLRASVSRWIDISTMSDDQSAAQVRSDKIDILVDLAGHTAHNRLLLFARKPAPVQVTYLGYPDTTGIRAMDYRITDALADPPGSSDALHTEKLIRLSDGFLCFRPPGDMPPIAPAPASTRTHITFGSFNYLPKLSDATLRLWSKILAAVPNSKLLIKSQSLTDVATKTLLQTAMAVQGIPLDRLILLSPETKYKNHLEAYNQVDIALDSLPYSGTATTLEALAMGVPVISLPGQTHASRVGLSILTHAGFTEFIARDADDYVRIAADLAANLPRLQQLRSNLRPRLLASPLCNAAAFTRKLEAAYAQM